MTPEAKKNGAKGEAGPAGAQSPYKVAVVDDHPIMCAAIVSTFRSSEGFVVVGQGGSADDAIEIARRDAPNLMLVDLNMPGSGLAAIQWIVKNSPSTKVVVLTAYDDYNSVTQALAAGAHGYALKGISGSELLELAQSVIGGNSYLPSELAIRLLKSSSAAPQAPGRNDDPTSLLSPREYEILRLLSAGKSNCEIAAELNLAESTVKNHVTSILDKLQVRNRVEAALVVARGRPLH